MENSNFEILAVAYLRGELNEEGIQQLESLLEQHEEYRDTLKALESSWKGMDQFEVPEPSDRMDQQFFELLGREMEKAESPGKLTTSFKALLDWLFRPQLAYAMVFMAIGLGAGYVLTKNVQQQPGISVAAEEVTEVREKLVLTLLDQPSASKRLEGVSEINKITNVDATVITALLKTLNKDTNVNVRLAAIASLTNYVDNPTVRQGLIQSIPNQESPIIQVTLANLMLALEEKKSIAPFKQLLQEKELDTTVKKKIEETIASII